MTLVEKISQPEQRSRLPTWFGKWPLVYTVAALGLIGIGAWLLLFTSSRILFRMLAPT